MNTMRKHAGLYRLTATLLCLCMAVSAFAGLSAPRLARADGTATSDVTQGVTRQADPSTMDDYTRMLDFHENTRYAGRLWSDKSVFAYGVGDTGDRKDQWKNNTLQLTEALDGVTGSVALDADFLHVYSAIGSSQRIEEPTPLDVMFVLDVSGSMGQIARNDPAEPNEFATTPIYKTVQAVNSAIEGLLKESPDSRFGIAIYGATAAVLVPLGHYTQSDETDFLQTAYMEKYGTTQGLHFTLTATLKDANGNVVKYYADNGGLTSNDAHGERGTGNREYKGTGGVTTGDRTSEVDPLHVGHITNPQAGLAIAMNEFIENNNERTWITSEQKECLRIPALIHLTDGQASDLAWIQPEAKPDDSQAWEKEVSNWNNVNWKYDLAYNSQNNSGSSNKWNASQLTGKGDATPVIFQTLMTAAYYKTAVDAFYNQDGIKDANGNAVSLTSYSIYASDTSGYESMEEGQVKDTINAILDPAEHFKNYDGAQESDQGSYINGAYELFEDWRTGIPVNKEYTTSTTSAEAGTNDITITLNVTQDQVKTGKYATEAWNTQITAGAVEKNINYVPEGNFLQTNFEGLADVFSDIIQQLTGTMFAPVAGTNDLGVADAVTFMDPVGKYMDIKDVKSLVLFGEQYGITKTAVYEYQWNHQYMVNKHGEGTVTALTSGWYTGDPMVGDEDGPYTIEQLQTKFGIEDSEDAWAKEWVYRVGFDIASQYVPTLANINDDNANETVTKMRNTTYTFYRIADEDDVRKKLHVNPAYLKQDQSEKDYIAENGNVEYDDNGGHRKVAGVYALADLRIWVEDTGDFNDTDVESGGVESDANFDEALWINIPSNMLPLRTVNIDLTEYPGDSKKGSYTTNLTSTSSGYKASFPLRVFYTVGVNDTVRENDNRINLAKAIDAEYIQQNKVASAAGETARGIDEGNVEFFSNWYNPLNRYSAYATSNTDYTFGDPVTTFSPAAGNRYYMFEKALPLYANAYVYVTSETEGNKWRRVMIEEDLADRGEDGRSYPATSFGGEIIAIDLELGEGVTAPKDADDATTKINKVLTTTPVDGDIVLLKLDRMTDVTKTSTTTDPFASDDYYFLPIEYYTLESGNFATWTQYAITRKGSEFGSAYEAAHITNGDMLCWHDVSGYYKQDYPYVSYSETLAAGNADATRGKAFIGWPIDPATGYYQGCNKDAHQVPNTGSDSGFSARHTEYMTKGQWVVCAKPGGLRVGGLSQSVQGKGGDLTQAPENELIKQYFEERYANSLDKLAGLNWTYYKNNVTRTANNYYVPTISNTSSIENSSVKVNVYLGNNGRLYVADTTLLVTKQFEHAKNSSEESPEKFNYQVYLANITGTLSAVRVRWNEASQSWQRQLHYIDLELDGQRFLQTQDGYKAMVAENGRRVVNNPNGEGYVYADTDNLTETYSGTAYYVYIGKNANAEEIVSPATGFRVYHNDNVDGNGEVETDDVIESDGKNGDKIYKADTVWLVSTTRYDSEWQPTEGTPLDPNAEGFSIDGHNDGTLTNFELLTMQPNATETTEIVFNTPYRTASAYWTQELTIGVNANPDGDGKDTAKESLEGTDLYDQILPNYDRPELFEGLNLEEIADHTVEFTLGNGEALLFSGIPANTYYRVTEKLTDEQLKAGYILKELSHKQQAGSVSTYRPGVQTLPVYYNPGTTYRDYYGSFTQGYPSDYAAKETENGLLWSLDVNGGSNSDAYLHYEPFHHTNAVLWEYYATMKKDATGDNHHQPDDVPDGAAPFWLWNGKKNENMGGSYPIADNPSCKTLNEGGCDEYLSDTGEVRHYMFRNGEMLDRHYQGEGSGYLRNIARYLVTPTVRFGVKGEEQDDASIPMTEYPSNADYNGIYSVFGNTGTFEESTNFVNTIRPEKTETEINGEEVDPVDPKKPDVYPGVHLGDEITYRVTWANGESKPATVTIVDELDPGVTYVEDTAKAYRWDDTVTAGEPVPEPITAKIEKTESIVDGVTYVSVTFVLPEQPSGARGYVELTVKVNENAKDNYTYNSEGGADKDGMTPGEGTDYKVLDRASVQVGNGAKTYTHVVENPIDEKTERTPGDGVPVEVGELITYDIRWKNDDAENTAYVIVEDTLDPGVDFVSAEWNETDAASQPVAHKLNVKVEDGEIVSNETEEKTADSSGTKPTISYNADTRTVTWQIGNQARNAEGVVTLVVRVNESAKETYTYDPEVGTGEQDRFVPGVVGDTDYKVLDRAKVTVGNVSHFTNIVENPLKEKTEVDPGDGKPVQVGQQITYEIRWKNDTSKEAYVVVTDTLDPGVEFVSASADPAIDQSKITYKKDEQQTVDTSADGTQKTTTAKHTVVWDIGMVDPGEEGVVTLVVTVSKEALKDALHDYHYKETDPTRPDDLEKGEGLDYKVVDRAKVIVDNRPHYTNIVENPLDEKKEVTPGAGEGVGYGDEIKFEITWTNDTDSEAWVVVTDPLDKGVDFVRAESDVTAVDSGYVVKDGSKTLEREGYNAQKVPGHTAYWDLGVQKPGASGTITLYVKVNKDANLTYDYTTEYDEPVEGEGTDYQVVDRAKITVGNESHYTNKVQNPLNEKTETNPGDGQPVEVGQQITYEIRWKNDTEAEEGAYVIVTDTLDPGVDFVSAEWNGIVLNVNKDAETGEIVSSWTPETQPNPDPNGDPLHTIRYDAGDDRTVTWLIGNQKPGAEGVVTLTVEVNENAKKTYTYNEGRKPEDAGPDTLDPGEGTDYEVLDRAKVTVGNESHFTNIVENPLHEKKELTPGEGEGVGYGDEIEYEIKWRNDTANAAWVVVTDPLDPGVDYVRAESDVTAVDSGYVVKDGLKTLSNEGYTDQTVSGHTAYWDFGLQPAGASGAIKLTVKVNKDAKVTYDYTAGADKPAGGTDSGTDYKVTDRAVIKVGNESHYTNEVQNPLKEKIETDPGDGEPVQVDQKITYEIRWKNDTSKKAYVVVTDTLDPGVDFDSATSDTPDGNGNMKAGVYYESGTAIPTSAGGATTTQIAARTVVWDIGEVDAGTEGVVTLTVTVNQNALRDYHYNEETDPTQPDNMAQGDGLDYEVVDRAKVIVDNKPRFTNEVENPLQEKKEITPGDGESVGYGDEIKFEITWRNDTGKAAWVVVTDPLDKGVDFVRAESNVTAIDSGYLADGQEKTLTYGEYAPQKVSGHTAYWDFGEQPAEASGTITLYVKVNKNAKVTYDYEESGDGLTGGTGTDYRVVDRAKITVGNESHYTNKVQNPLNEKTETNPGDGELVQVGDPITYEIRWKNDTSKDAYVVVTDTLDPGVNFVSATSAILDKDGNETASVNGEYYKKGETIPTSKKGDETTTTTAIADRTVVWDIGTVPAGTEGIVRLNVTVNENALRDAHYNEELAPTEPDIMTENGDLDYEVVDRAKVLVDNNAHFTNIVENPLQEKKELTPGEGESVGFGDEITYEIKWRNDTEERAWVVVTDPLDPGVDFVSADSNVPVVDTDYLAEGETKTLTNGTYTPQDVSGHTVYWDFGVQEPGASGTITLTVRVNKNAKVTYDYEDTSDGLTGGTGTDYKVTDRAVIKIGNESHYTNEVQNPLKEKTETQPGDGENVQIGDTITYEIRWKNDTEQDAYVVVTDTLDPGVDFVSAESDWTIDKDKINYDDDPQTVKTSEAGTTTTTAPRTVVWEIGTVPKGQEGTVTLTVKVNQNALRDHHYTVTDPTLPDEMVQGDGMDYKVVDRAKVIVDNKPHFTNEVENPLKEKEELTPGEGEGVGYGDEITFEITWTNSTASPAWVVVTDPLDPGVDYVRAESSAAARDFGYVAEGETRTLSSEGYNGKTVSGHTAYWDLGVQEAGARGTVRLTVKVNRNAKVTYDYAANADGLTGGNGTDYKVTDRAVITVGNESHYTNEVQNPLKEKTEVDPGDGENVQIGQQITYEIHWKNDTAKDAYVVVTDTLDPGVTFVSASAQPVLDPSRISYSDEARTVYTSADRSQQTTTAPRTVVWEIGTVSAGVEGTVTLAVTVNENALNDYHYAQTDPAQPDEMEKGDGMDYEVVDRAKVIVDNNARFTNEVENPLKEKKELTPGEGESVGYGDEITFEITWTNSTANPAWVVVTDPLDPGVDYVRAESDVSARDSGYVPDGDSKTLTNGTYNPQTVSGHSAYWDFGEQPAGAKGTVTLTVQVNRKAKVTYDYTADKDTLTGGEGTDYKVTDRAVITVGNESQYTNEVQNPLKEKIETDPGDGETVQIGQQITYEIRWKNDTTKNAYVVVTDTLDPGVTFVSASADPALDASRISYGDEARDISTSADGAQKTTLAPRTVAWEIGTVAAGAEGTVTLAVTVNEKAMLRYEYTETHPELPDNMQPGSAGETDYRVVDRAKVIVDNTPHFTNEVENPLNEKKELTPGEGEIVGDGVEITYEITWTNTTASAAWVVVTDPLDPGVDYVRAESDVAARDSGYVGAGATKTLTNGTYNPQTVPGHTAYWDLGEQPAGAKGSIKLTVKVNKNANVSYDYEADKDTLTGGVGTDNKVTDRAKITVGNESHYTNEVQNPLNEKTELTPGAGEGVEIGQTVTYQIVWKNDTAKDAYVVVTDTLDPGVDYVSASADPALAASRITYADEARTVAANAAGDKAEVAARTVVWEIGTVAAGARGTVTLSVKVNEHAKELYQYTVTEPADPDNMTGAQGETDYRIVDRAKVGVDNKWHFTNEVENPLKEKKETTPGDGVSVRPGQEISFEIEWEGRADRASYVVVTDKLDPGVEFVSAGQGGVYAAAQRTLSYKLADGRDVTETIPGHAVVWNLGQVEAGAHGKVTLTVRVKQDGEPEKDYEYGETDPKKPDDMTGGTGKDNQVVNRAKITVDNEPHFTNEVSNPFGGPDKTETKIDREPYDGIGDVNPIALLALEQPSDQDIGVSEGDLTLKPNTDDTYVGPRVFPGDRITYEISWQNYKSEPAAVVIRDPLDVNVKFVSASFYWTDTTDSAGTPYTQKPDGSAYSENLTLGSEGDEKPKSAKSGDSVASTVVEGGKEKEVVSPIIAYTYDGNEPAEVEWNLGVQPAGSKGKVRLIVQVLSSAKEVGYVDNWAYVRVNGDPEQETRIIENPTPSWQKEEKPYDEENKENLPYEGDLVQAGQLIHYEIEWYNDTDKEQAVVITDTLDDGVDFTSAWYGDRNNPYVRYTAQDAENNVPGYVATVEENGFKYEVTVSYNRERREVTWTLGKAEAGAGMPSQSGGFVDLDVTVNERALNKWVYVGDTDEHTASDTEKDHQVVNRAKIQVGEVENGGGVHYTPIVDNPLPEKTEPDPGPDVMVSVGQTVTYNIHWENRYDKSARVIITDPLDDGADFKSASFGGVTLEQGQTEARSEDDAIVIAYDTLLRTVVWTLEERPAGSSGDVELKITVNENAHKTWAYEPDQDAGKPGEGDDLEIVNRARVQVGNRSAFTSEIENPVPDKQERTPGEGETVNIGDEITYDIFWKNGHDEEADVVIEDTLDPGLTFRSASDGGAYDERTRTVTWTLPKQGAKAQGHVSLTVTVNENALKRGIVENTADVQIGRDPKAKTRVIPNPTGPHKTETHVNGQDVTDRLEPASDGYTGPYVKFGDDVTYRIDWGNSTRENGVYVPATVIVKDPLDKGVDFASASFGSVTLQKGQTVATGSDENGAITIAYDAATHTVTWTLENRAPKSAGSVTLNVGVNMMAMAVWQYGPDDTPVVNDGEQDGQIVDRAAVKVGDGPWMYTDVMHNPAAEIPNVPMTGDESRPGLWALLACASALCVLLLMRKKQENS